MLGFSFAAMTTGASPSSTGGAIFVCRHCHRLAYESQHEQPYDRALRRTQNIRERLGASGNWYVKAKEAESRAGRIGFTGLPWRTAARRRPALLLANSCDCFL